MTETVTSSPIVHQLLKCLEIVEDPRKARGKRHPLEEVLLIAIMGCICGCDDAEALEDWGRKEIAWLSQYLPLRHGPPSQDVYLRVFAAIKPETFREAFARWVPVLMEKLGVAGQIAIDGQTHRGSRDRRKGQSPVHMVHALACEFGVVLGQRATDAKSNEITAIPALLELLDLEGALVSIDAMGCQVKIAKTIRNKGGDYLFGLKGNQTELQTQTQKLFEEALRAGPRSIEETIPEVTQATEVDGGHGRVETRRAIVCNDFGDWVPAAKRFSDLVCLIAVVSTREDEITEKTTTETRYYVSSRQHSAEEANAAVRRHWLVENQLHWCLDVTFKQDANQTRTKHAAQNLGLIRHFALNIIRQHTGDRYSVPRRRRKCDYDAGYRRRLLGLRHSDAARG